MVLFQRRTARTLLESIALSASLAVPAAGQGVAILRVGAGGRTQLTPASHIAIPIVVDMSAAANLDVASITLRVDWDPARLAFDSATTGGFNTLTLNTASAASGFALFSAFSPSGVTATTALGTLFFTATSGTGMTTVTVTPSAMGNSFGVDVFPQARVKNLDVCIGTSGVYGDANADGSVNIIDAQQIARFSVGLTVANSVILVAQGDVNSDNNINILDAQQIARFAVGLTAAARINTLVSAPPIASTITVNNVFDATAGGTNIGVLSNLAALAPGREAKIALTALDASNGNITPCAAITYSSSNQAVATVSNIGVITAVASGSATITMASGSAQATVNVTVPATLTTNAWTNTAGGNWNVATNWSLGRVPATGDSVVINAAGTYTVTLNIAPSVSFVTVGGSTGTQTFALGANALVMSGGLIVNPGGVVTTNGSTMSGTGSLLNNGTVILTGGNVSIPIDNRSQLTQRNATTFAAPVINRASGTFAISGDVNCCAASATFTANFANAGTLDLTSIGGSNNATLAVTGTGFSVANTGTIRITGPGGARTIAGAVTNTGLVDVNGSVDVTVSRAFDNATAGVISVGPGRTMTVTSPGSLNSNGGSFSGGGSIVFNSATLISSFAGASAATTTTFNSSTLSGTQPFVVPAGQQFIATNSTFTAPLDVQGSAVFRGGNTVGAVSVAGSGILNVQGDGSCCSTTLTVNQNLTNAGLVQLTSVNGSTTATLTTATGGSVTNQAGGIIRSVAGTGGGRTLNAAVTNQGLVDVSTADLAIAKTFTNAATGTLNVASSRTVSTSGATTIVYNGGTFSGGGTIALSSATVTLNADFTTGATLLSLSGATIDGTGTLINGPSQTLSVTSSTIDAPLTNQGVLVFLRTNIVNGAFATAANSVLRITGDGSCCASATTFASGFTNLGLIELTSITGGGAPATLAVTNGTLTNATGGTIAPLAGAGGTRTVQAVVDNQGTFDLTGGVDISLSRSFTNSGTVNVGAGRVFTVPNAVSFIAAVGGSYPGAGTLNFTSGSVLTLNTNLDNGATQLLLGATTVNGTGTLTNLAGRTLSVTSSTINTPLTNQGVLILLRGNSINGALVAAANSTLRVVGDGSCCASSTTVAAGFVNAGLIELTSITGGGAPATLIVTAGTLTNSATGTIAALAGAGGSRTIQSVVDNQGALNVNAGVDLTLARNFINSGIVNIGAGRTLTVPNAVTLTTSAGASYPGPGTLSLTSGSVFTLNTNFDNAVVQLVISAATVNGTGTLTNAVGQTLTVTSSTIDAPIVNQGLLILLRGNAINGALTTTANSTLRVVGDGSCCSSTTTVANAFTNVGRIELTSITGGGAPATLAITTGALTNAVGGTIAALAGVGGSRVIQAVVDNQGTLDLTGGVDMSLARNLSNSGTVNIGAGRTLSVPNPLTFTAAPGGNYPGTGTLNFTSGSVFALSSNFDNSTTQVVLNSATVNGPGTLTNAAGQTITVTSSTINAPVVNQGILVFLRSNSINGAFTTSAGSTLRIAGDGSCCSTSATYATGFTNVGLIELTSVVGSAGATLALTAGTLVNATTGTISSLAGTGGPRAISGSLTNQGTLNIHPGSAGSLSIGNNGSVTNTASGVINLELASASSFDVFVEPGTGAFTLDGTLNVSLINGYAPATGASHAVMTGPRNGAFATTHLPPGMTIQYNPTSVVVTQP